MATEPRQRQGASRRTEAPRRSEASRRGAEQHRIGLGDRSRGWLRHHIEVARQALIRLWSTPLASLMTLAVLAIALALPGFIFTALKNVEQLTAGLDTDPHISLYLDVSLSDERIDSFSRELLLRDDLASVELISRDKGLEDFKAYTRFDDLLEFFDTNPLPAVITLIPRDDDPAQLQVLQQKMAALPEVEEARLDLEWVRRLGAFMALAERSAWVLGGLLALTVLLVVGNTVRMTIESRRDEIQVSKLVGATDAWVRRPFLYSGVWFGTFGALLAWLLAQLALALISEPVQALAVLYLNGYVVQGLGPVESLTLLLSGILLGLGGAWIAVGRHLRDIEPG
ncbi:permease-like cell division protein FtsX [Marinobacterium sp. D7]|uniref:permease-like cell division protein FtsX n=1 Tax=Marinobacterium ramblicola TaxID=2849041 RepID=UPI001C2D5705|nr:permease-like cell division protein FtsX [Marinobacterium ramblicola]MBV1787782.1 permease-like cell division protein FtsX [Marinobacterium ramblicola]